MKETAINPFLAVLSTWRSYFTDYYEGLGTTYERVLLHKIFQRLDTHYEIGTVLEVPSFGMTGVSGINSMWWAKQGKAVTVVDNNKERLSLIRRVWAEVGLTGNIMYHANFDVLPFNNLQFDLSWNFAALWFVPDVATFAGELRRVTRRIILISVPNHTGWGYRLREKYAENLEGIYVENIRPQAIISNFAQEGWQLVDQGLFDVPPWPDIAMKKEDLLQKLGLAPLLRWWKARHSPQKPSANSANTIVDFYAGRAPELEQEILRFAFLENAPQFFKKVWAHHRYFVFARWPGGEE